MDILDNVYLVNLDNRKDRLLFMDYKLQELGIKFTRIPAILGSDHSDEYYNYMRQFTKHEIKNNQNINSLGAYGILLTYKNLVTPLYKENKYITIFEDDVFFHKNFNSLLEEYKPIIAKHDVIWLGCQQVRWRKQLLDEISINGYCKTITDDRYMPFGAYGIVYSSRFLKILNYELNNNWDTKNIRNADKYISILLDKYKFLKSMAIHPNLIIPQVFESDNMGHRDIHTMCEARKWDLSLYRYCDVTGHFCDLYKKVTQENISLRQIKKNTYPDISNIDISRIIENKNKSFVFIITSYNNENWVYKNIKSIVNQRYPFWRIIYMDDCSEDRTVIRLNKIVNSYNISEKITIIKNTERKSQSYNRWYASKLCQDDEICCMLDGDDWLVSDTDVLQKLNNLYIKNKLLMSYGQFYYYEGDDKNMKLCGTNSYDKNDIINNNYRHKWCTQHLRTMEASLMKTIPEEYLKLDGKFITVCTDMAEMYWCLERSYGRHMNSGFPTVVYNKLASMSYINSYYNRNKNKEHELYRDRVEEYLKKYTLNHRFHLQPDYIWGLEGRDWITDDSDSDSDSDNNHLLENTQLKHENVLDNSIAYYKNLLDKIKLKPEPQPEPEPESEPESEPDPEPDPEPEPRVKKYNNYTINKFQSILNKYRQNLDMKKQEVELKQHETESIKIITQLYKEVLYRVPDDEGLSHWVNKYNNGMSRVSIKHVMMNSKEGILIRKNKDSEINNRAINFKLKKN